MKQGSGICTANEGPVRIQYTCLVSIYVFLLSRNETARLRYFQHRIIMFWLPISTFMYLWAIYIFPGSVTEEWRNWERGHAVSFLGMMEYLNQIFGTVRNILVTLFCLFGWRALLYLLRKRQCAHWLNFGCTLQPYLSYACCQNLCYTKLWNDAGGCRITVNMDRLHLKTVFTTLNI